MLSDITLRDNIICLVSCPLTKYKLYWIGNVFHCSWYLMIWSSNLVISQITLLLMDLYVALSLLLCGNYMLVDLFPGNKWSIFLVFSNHSQVKIQKESEVRLKIIGTRVDATEIVRLCFIYWHPITCLPCSVSLHYSWFQLWAYWNFDGACILSFTCAVKTKLNLATYI